MSFVINSLQIFSQHLFKAANIAVLQREAWDSGKLHYSPKISQLVSFRTEIWMQGPLRTKSTPNTCAIFLTNQLLNSALEDFFSLFLWKFLFQFFKKDSFSYFTIYFRLCWAFCAQAFSSCRSWGILSRWSAQASHWGGRLSCPAAHEILPGPPRPGIKPVSPALAGELSTTGSSKKSWKCYLHRRKCTYLNMPSLCWQIHRHLCQLTLYQNTEDFYHPRIILPSLFQLLPAGSKHCFDLFHQKYIVSVLELHINEIIRYVLFCGRHL